MRVVYIRSALHRVSFLLSRNFRSAFLAWFSNLHLILHARVPMFLCSVAFLVVSILLIAISSWICGHLCFRSSSFHLRFLWTVQQYMGFDDLPLAQEASAPSLYQVCSFQFPDFETETCYAAFPSQYSGMYTHLFPRSVSNPHTLVTVSFLSFLLATCVWHLSFMISHLALTFDTLPFCRMCPKSDTKQPFSQSP